MPRYKVLIVEVDNVDLVNQTELSLDASNVYYNPATSGLTSTDVQAAIDELAVKPWLEKSTVSTYTNSSAVTGVLISELSLPIVSGRRYYVEMALLVRSNNTNSNAGITFTSADGAGIDGAFLVQMMVRNDDRQSTWGGTISALNDYVTGEQMPVTNQNTIVNVQGTFIATASGTITPTFRSRTGGSVITVRPSSTILRREFT